ncbi:MAG TPA: glycosyltransferase family 2 protein [Verrucomicrobiota bacterium]|nr:glycosyltransferase family 2 protein [Verrucomicrobiota bacterium]HNT14305.1 glycosyltransferase family 2 protein [Verrucomicrobiota bacterium]
MFSAVRVAEDSTVLVSVIIVLYNDGAWLPRCLESLRQQTLASRCEVIVADNASTDDSAQIAQQLLAGWPGGRFLSTGGNVGFGPGNNRAAAVARGRYLYFINCDTWFEPDCLEQLYTAAERRAAAAAGATILEYADDTLTARGSDGMDLCGNPVAPRRDGVPDRLFCIAGFYFIRREVFARIGQFDERYFMYGEELDLSWRLWACGEQVVYAGRARVHHRGAVGVNPDGGVKPRVHRTSELKRYYANRNQLLTIAKNAQHLLLGLLIPAVLLTCAEGVLTLAMTRRWQTFRRISLAPLADFFRLLPQTLAARRRLAAVRRHGDFWMLRFLRCRFGRMHEVQQILRKGFPRFDA